MNLDNYLNTQTNTAAAVFAQKVGVPASSLSLWRKGRRPVPARHCLAIERATGGLVTRLDLRADARQIWPDLADEPTTREIS